LNEPVDTAAVAIDRLGAPPMLIVLEFAGIGIGALVCAASRGTVRSAARQPA